MKDTERLLGALEEFKKVAERRLEVIEKKVDDLNKFKLRVTAYAVVAVFLVKMFVELASSLAG